MLLVRVAAWPQPVLGRCHRR